MKISCQVVRDLLPLYLDGVCSEDSRTLVRDHLSGCESCRLELQALEGELSVPRAEQDLRGEQIVKEISRHWRKGMFKAALKGVISILIPVLIIALVLYLFFDIRIVPVN